MQLFMPWFFHCWAPDPVATKVVNKSLHEVIPTAAYLSAKGRQLDPLLRRYLVSLLTAPFTFLEVLVCDPGTGMTLRDVMTQEEHAVTERAASRGMEPGDLLFGQLASVDRLTMLEASNGFAIPPMEKAQIIKLRAHIASAHPVITHQVLRDWDFELLDLFHEIADRLYNPRLPTLQNTDGEPLSLYKLVFELNVPPQAAFDALKHLALDELGEDLLADATRDSEDKLTRVRFSWKKHGNKMHAGWTTPCSAGSRSTVRVLLQRSTRRRAPTRYARRSRRHSVRAFVIVRAKSIAGEDACRPAGGRRRTRWR